MTFAEIVKKSRVLKNSKCLLSRWLVSVNQAEGSVYEIKIVEISRSRKFIRVHAEDGSIQWWPQEVLDKEYILVEELK